MIPAPSDQQDTGTIALVTILIATTLLLVLTTVSKKIFILPPPAQYFIWENYLRDEKMSLARDKNAKLIHPLIFITFSSPFSWLYSFTDTTFTKT